MSGFEPWANFKEAVKALQSRLEPGITLSLTLDNCVVYAQYTVRAQRRGKRVTVGTYNTIDGANTALFSYKTSGVAVTSNEEAAAKSVRKLIDSGSIRVNAVEIEEDKMLDIVKLLEFNNVEEWRLHSDNDTVELKQPDGTIFLLLPTMQFAYNNWKQKKGELEEEAKLLLDGPKVKAAKTPQQIDEAKETEIEKLQNQLMEDDLTEEQSEYIQDRLVELAGVTNKGSYNPKFKDDKDDKES